jgi:hypothetical protein
LADGYGLPRPDAEAWPSGDVRLPLVWREHYVAVVRDANEGAARASLEEQGFEVIAFDGPESGWASLFARLAASLGRGK